jgi:hypothetical protein
MKVLLDQPTSDTVGGLFEKKLTAFLAFNDSDKNSVSRGHELKPRFLTYVQSDFSDVEAVVKKMLEKIPSSSEIKCKGDDST